MKVPFLDLSKVNNPYVDEIDVAIRRVTHSGNYILGEEAGLFEQEFAQFCGKEYCVSVSNGTSALFLALRALNLKSGSEVIIPSNSYVATVLAICHNNLKPVLVEPDIYTYNIDPAKIEEKITSNTSAVLVTHLYGRICEMDAICSITDKHGLKLIEDCAQAHGGVHNGNRVGTYSDISAFSFYPTKNLGAMGDAGAILTGNPELAERISRMRNHGFKKRDYSVIKGYNSRLDEIQAAVLRIKLKHLNQSNLRRRVIAKKYTDKIISSKLVLPLFTDSNVWHLFVIRSAERQLFMNYMGERGIETKIHYPVPFYRQIAFKEFNHLSMPISDKIHNEVLSLPLNVAITDDEINYIADTINSY